LPWILRAYYGKAHQAILAGQSIAAAGTDADSEPMLALTRQKMN
jgi:hypothetical protein